MTGLEDRLLAVAEATGRIPEGHRRAAVAIVLRDGEVLLMQRAECEGDPWSGQVSLPGGHAEDGDDSLTGTALREALEEVGADLSESRLAGALEPVRARVRGVPIDTTILPVVFEVEGEPELTLGPEAQAAFWFPLERAVAGELDSTLRYQRGEAVVQLPCWEFEEHVVWGLTHGILSVFTGLDPRWPAPDA